jgi:hypothetical protein
MLLYFWYCLLLSLFFNALTKRRIEAYFNGIRKFLMQLKHKTIFFPTDAPPNQIVPKLLGWNNYSLKKRHSFSKVDA